MKIEDILTTTEAAELLGVSTARIRQLCLAGVLGVKRTGVWLISRESLLKYRQNRRKSGRPAREIH